MHMYNIMNQFIQSEPNEFQNKRKRIRAESYDYKKFDEVKQTYLNKESFVNRTNDIQGAQAISQIAKKQPNLGSMALDAMPYPQARTTLFTTNRVVNPLLPTYKLPSAPLPPPIEHPKLVRDNINITDIDGTRPKKDPWYNKTRNIDPYTEIEGTKAKPMKFLNNPVNKFDVSDIMKKKGYLRQEAINPIDPRYKWIDNQIIGYVQGSHVRDSKKLKESHIGMNTSDIKQAQASTLNDQFLMRKNRKDFRELNKTSDIPGAQTGTLIKSIITKRQVNPLTPSYPLF